jgi:hypothetical protein
MNEITTFRKMDFVSSSGKKGEVCGPGRGVRLPQAEAQLIGFLFYFQLFYLKI